MLLASHKRVPPWAHINSHHKKLSNTRCNMLFKQAATLVPFCGPPTRFDSQLTPLSNLANNLKLQSTPTRPLALDPHASLIDNSHTPRRQHDALWQQPTRAPHSYNNGIRCLSTLEAVRSSDCLAVSRPTGQTPTLSVHEAVKPPNTVAQRQMPLPGSWKLWLPHEVVSTHFDHAIYNHFSHVPR